MTGCREREGVAGEIGDRLLDVVFVNAEVLGEQAVDHPAVFIFDGHRHADEVDVNFQLEQFVIRVAGAAASLSGRHGLDALRTGRRCLGIAPVGCGICVGTSVLRARRVTLGGGRGFVVHARNRGGDVWQRLRRWRRGVFLRARSIRQRLLCQRKGRGQTHCRQQESPSRASTLQHNRWLVSKKPELSLSITATGEWRYPGPCYSQWDCNTMKSSGKKKVIR